MITLIVLATLVPEVLFGSTTLSRIYGLPLEAALYGPGALLIREVVRRRGGGWPALLLLGAAYAVVEEGLTEPTWFTTQIFGGHPYGSALGVYWLYAAFNMGYHAIWSMSIPILLTEMLFPSRRHEPWLPPPGIVVAGVVYAAAAVVTWVVWNRVIVPGVFHVHQHIDTRLSIGAGVVLVVLLALGWWASRALPVRAGTGADGAVPSPWVVGVLALAATLAWFAGTIAPDAWVHRVPFPLVLVWYAGIVAVAALALHAWTGRRGWGDVHRAAACTGALVGQMAGGFALNSYQLTGADLLFKIGVDAAAIVLLALLVAAAGRRRGAEVPSAT